MPSWLTRLESSWPWPTAYHILAYGLKPLTQRHLLGVVLLPLLKGMGWHASFQRTPQSDPNFPPIVPNSWPTRIACQLWASEPTTWERPRLSNTSAVGYPTKQVPFTLAGHWLLLLWITSSYLWYPASKTGPSSPCLLVLMPLCSLLPLVKASVYVTNRVL